MNPILLGLAIALAISLSGNAGLSYLYLDKRDEAVQATGERDQARGAASACSDATEDLRNLADKRAKEAKTARAAAATAAKDRDQKADEIMSTPASDTDDCKAAQHRVDNWLKGRK